MEPNTVAVPPSPAPSVHTSNSAFIDIGPVCASGEIRFVLWVESVVTFTLVRALDREYLVVCLSV